MSASLVGSEMCIRDSLPDPLRKRRGCALAGVLRAESQPESVVGDAKAPCLLYTSDAADDM
eukprot:10704773-Alexandrium_andersonii.AAC.1